MRTKGALFLKTIAAVFLTAKCSLAAESNALQPLDAAANVFASQCPPPSSFNALSVALASIGTRGYPASHAKCRLFATLESKLFVLFRDAPLLRDAPFVDAATHAALVAYFATEFGVQCAGTCEVSLNSRWHIVYAAVAQSALLLDAAFVEATLSRSSPAATSPIGAAFVRWVVDSATLRSAAAHLLSRRPAHLRKRVIAAYRVLCCMVHRIATLNDAAYRELALFVATPALFDAARSIALIATSFGEQAASTIGELRLIFAAIGAFLVAGGVFFVCLFIFVN